SRIINLFPYDARSGLLSDLSIGLRAIICQRLVRNTEGELQPAVEILLNTSLISELIKNGEITQIKEAMEQSLYPGSQPFDRAPVIDTGRRGLPIAARGPARTNRLSLRDARFERRHELVGAARCRASPRLSCRSHRRCPDRST